MKRVGVGLGKHIIAELFECDSSTLDNVNLIKEILLEAAVASNSTVINYSFHRFKPYGVSGYVLIAESHISIHTWPEYGYAAVDVFTCGDRTDPWKGLEILKKKLKAKKLAVMEITRGANVEEEYNGYWDSRKREIMREILT
ncbi:MAG: S-adenosylmethionine decarboxylase proenzyme [Thermoprotei archaeon]|nr:MAG: S-adenosylmethionine decarboxylase proenzyme [Thermoprotei archaeon]